MTKKSNNRKLSKELRQTPQRYRRLDVDIPMEMWERLEKALGVTKEKGLLPAATGPRDFLLATVFVNGLAMVEADLYKRGRQDSLVVTPQEAQAMATRLQGVKRG